MNDLTNGLHGINAPTGAEPTTPTRSHRNRYVLERKIPVFGPTFAIAASSTGNMLAFGGKPHKIVVIIVIGI